MAAVVLSPPGHEYGPCIRIDCEHTDCVAIRKMAGKICRLCDEAIGYDRRFVLDRESNDTDDPHYVHELCDVEDLEKHRKGDFIYQ